MIKFTIMNRNKEVLEVESDGLKAISRWVGEKHIKIPINIYPENITPDAVVEFCESRQPPRTRYNIDELLRKKYKMKEYLPVQMCRKSRGITMEDNLWIRFEGDDNIRYEDIGIRQ